MDDLLLEDQEVRHKDTSTVLEVKWDTIVATNAKEIQKPKQHGCLQLIAAVCGKMMLGDLSPDILKV